MKRTIRLRPELQAKVARLQARLGIRRLMQELDSDEEIDDHIEDDDDEEEETQDEKEVNETAEEEEDGDELLEAKQEENIQVNFTFNDVKEEDDLWIRSLISKGWTGRALQLDEMGFQKIAENCARQPEIGTYVKTEEDQESVLAFATVLNAKTMMPEPLRKKISSLLNTDDKAGWIIREALVNVPPEVTMQLLQCLKDDLEWAEENKFASYKHFILLSPCYVDASTAAPPAQKSSRKKAGKDVQDESVEYALGEDYVLANNAKAKTLFHLSRTQASEGVDLPESLDHAPWGCHALLLDKKGLMAAIHSLASA